MFKGLGWLLSKFCYAERVFPRAYGKRAFTNIQIHPDRLDEPIHWRRPRRVFVNSMSDLFHEYLVEKHEGYLRAIFGAMILSQRHTFQVLTKRPEHMRAFMDMKDEGFARLCVADLMNRVVKPPATCDADFSWPPSNVWLGVSAENQNTFDQRIQYLVDTPATVRFLSYEPALGSLSLDGWTGPGGMCAECGWIPLEGVRRYVEIHGDSSQCLRCGKYLPNHLLDWVIAGGESGPRARPSDPRWFRSVRDQCQAAGVPFFFKQWGEFAPKWTTGTTPGWESEIVRLGKKQAGRLLDGREWNEFPKLSAPTISTGR